MNKIFKTEKGTPYSYKTYYIVKYIDSNGLLKDFENLCGGGNMFDTYNTEDEAVLAVAEKEKHNAIILKEIYIDYYPARE